MGSKSVVHFTGEHPMRRLVFACLACGTAAWLQPYGAGCSPASGSAVNEGGEDRPQACSSPAARAGPIVASESEAEEATRRRLKVIMLEQEGRRRIARRRETEPIVAKDLARVRKYGGVSGTPGIMMGPPDLSS
jgi:hypothetical protein